MDYIPSAIQQAWDLSTDAYVLLRPDGTVACGNEKTRKLLDGCNTHHDVLKRFLPADSSCAKAINAVAPAAYSRCTCNFQINSGELVSLEVESIPVNGGRWLVFRSMSAPFAAQPSVDFTAAVLDSAEAIILVVDRDGRFVRFNRRAQNLTGYSEEEVIGKSFASLFIRPDDLSAVLDEFRRLLSGNFPSQMENPWVMRDGSVRNISWSNTGMRDAAGNVAYVVSSGIDVTEFRGAEKALASLSERALKQMQGERQKLSRFLHDTVSQDLVALSFSLSRLQQDQNSPASLQALDRSFELLDQCCRDIRLLSYILAPPLFEEIGLIPALQWYGGQLQREAGMNVELEFDPLPDPPPSAEVQSILFSTLQACVARSVRHMDKSRKRVSLRMEASSLTLRYESFSQKATPVAAAPETGKLSRSLSQELEDEFSVIRERLRHFRGKLNIEQRPESISVVTAIPVEVGNIEAR